MIPCESPNFDERQLPVSLLVLHYTGMKSGQAALEQLCDPAAKVSAHYLVEEDGRVFALVAERHRAWHAGASFWRGITDVNSASIGIEIVNPGHEFGYRAFPQVQMEAVRDLCRDVLTRHSIPPQNIVGHSDIAPERKEDPGELFNWKWLAQEGIGAWPAKHSGYRSRNAADLPLYGYNPAVDEEKAVVAFQRHFRPTALTGRWDAECGQILAGLLEIG